MEFDDKYYHNFEVLNGRSTRICGYNDELNDWDGYINDQKYYNINQEQHHIANYHIGDIISERMSLTFDLDYDILIKEINGMEEL